MSSTNLLAFSFCSAPRIACGLALMTAALCVSGCAVQTRSGVPGPADPDATEEFTETESGLMYRILRKGNGQKPSEFDAVTVDYVGWLDSGQEFDSSYEQPEPIKFGLKGVITGWTEGLQYVSEGGMIELQIPSELGYGAQGSPGSIPPNARLNFKIELHEVHSLPSPGN